MMDPAVDPNKQTTNLENKLQVETRSSDWYPARAVETELPSKHQIEKHKQNGLMAEGENERKSIYIYEYTGDIPFD